jgi:biopolymer transport protein ExbD
MAGGDVAQRERKTKGKKKKKKGRRLGVRIDMTPLVDVAFLLLTFFMLTTSMSRPQTMEINLPPDKDVKVDVAESNLLTLRIDKEGAIYWSAGIGAPKLLPAGTLRTFLKEQATNPKVVALIKIDREGKYINLVDIIDELTNFANIQRFSLAPMTDQDKELLKKAQA